MSLLTTAEKAKIGTAIQPGVASIVAADISATAAIAKTQLAAAVQTSLGLADTALQPGAASIVNADISATAGIVKTKLASAVQTSLGLADTAVQPNTSPTLSGLTITGLAGVVKAAAGALSAATIVNADVSATAAIDGTKINPDFGSQNITTTGNLIVGASPATSGLIRVPHASKMIGLQSGGGGNLDILDFGTALANRVTLGNATSALVLTGSSVSTFGSLNLGNASLTFLSTIVSPVINQTTDATASVTGDTFTINAQDCSGTTAVTGGKMVIRAGNATGASGTRNGGAIDIQAGNGATAEGLGSLKTGGGVTRVGWNATGLGFFGVSPVAQPADLGAPATASFADVNTYLGSLRTNVLRALGLTA